jgi:hypothetical protein
MNSLADALVLLPTPVSKAKSFGAALVRLNPVRTPGSPLEYSWSFSCCRDRCFWGPCQGQGLHLSYRGDFGFRVRGWART